ncbi:MAG: ATP-binding protein [Hyphomonadaceae bacterium]|nr:ATP-binding protein [Hyphomonadaceae bacterium]
MQFSVNTFARATDPEALRIAACAQRQGLKTRLFAAFLAAGLLTSFVGWQLALAWAVIVLIWDAGVVQRIYDRVIIPLIDTDPDRGEQLAAALCFVGCSLYCAAWSMAWLVGGAPAGFMAGIWFGVTLIHALVYFSNVRLVFAACMAPPTVCALVMPFIGPLDLLGALAVVGVAAQAVYLVISAANDRNQLIATLAAQSAARQAAEEASTAKSQFLANMSHELRTPLNAVIGYAEILEEDLDADGKTSAAADANRIRKAARHLLGLINEVLDLSKIEAGRMEINAAPCDVLQVVSDAVEQTRPAAEARGNVLRVQAPDDLPQLLLDGPKLGQCLLNFLSNAAKFTENGVIDVRVALDNGLLRIDVTDSGCGIAPADAARLFRPFTQVDDSFTRRAGGTGLGLVITRRLTELMGGDVSFTSARGAGSTFTLRLAVETAALANGPAGRACVLVVEDEAAARDLTRRALASLPFDVRTAGDVAGGLAAFHALAPALVVLDIHLPDGAGWEVLAEVRRTRPDVPVLVVTIDDDRARALALGAADHMQKPADREALCAAVARLTSAALAKAA